MYFRVGRGQINLRGPLNRRGPLREPRGPYLSDLPGFHQRDHFRGQTYLGRANKFVRAPELARPPLRAEGPLSFYLPGLYQRYNRRNAVP